MKRFLSPFAVAAMIGLLALVALLVYGLAQSTPDRGIEEALARGEPKRRPNETLAVNQPLPMRTRCRRL